MTEPSAKPRVRPAVLSDAEALAALGARTFTEAFGADNTPEDLAGFLASTYSPEIQERELRDPSMHYAVADHPDGLAGFALVTRGEAPECVTDAGTVELQRIYVLRAWHGSGLADDLMRHAFAEASRHGATSIWLGVWERNARAIRFYERHGFTRVGSKVFVVGSDAQHDAVMLRPLAKSGEAPTA